MLRAAQPGVMAISKAVGEETTIRRVAAVTGGAVRTDKVRMVAAGDGVVTNHTAIMK